jgi:hypothetical protein
MEALSVYYLRAPASCKVGIHVTFEASAFIEAHDESLILCRLEISDDALDG